MKKDDLVYCISLGEGYGMHDRSCTYHLTHRVLNPYRVLSVNKDLKPDRMVKCGSPEESWWELGHDAILLDINAVHGSKEDFKQDDMVVLEPYFDLGKNDERLEEELALTAEGNEMHRMYSNSIQTPLKVIKVIKPPKEWLEYLEIHGIPSHDILIISDGYYDYRVPSVFCADYKSYLNSFVYTGKSNSVMTKGDVFILDNCNNLHCREARVTVSYDKVDKKKFKKQTLSSKCFMK